MALIRPEDEAARSAAIAARCVFVGDRFSDEVDATKLARALVEQFRSQWSSGTPGMIGAVHRMTYHSRYTAQLATFKDALAREIRQIAEDDDFELQMKVMPRLRTVHFALFAARR